MKIGIDARFVGPQGTGLGKYTEKLIENLAKIDKKNYYVIFLNKSNWNFFKLPKNFSKTSADVQWYSFNEQIKLPSIFSKQNLDLLHIPHFNVPIFYRGKFIVTIHDLIHHQFSEHAATTKNPLIFKLKRMTYKKVIQHAINKSAKIITPSNFVKSEILKNFNISPDKIVVTYEAAEEEYFIIRPSSIVNRQSTLLYVGNAYPHKNLQRLLEAIKILNTNPTTPPSYKPINLIIVCPRDVFSQRLAGQIKSSNLQNHAKVPGFLPSKDLAKLFGQAQAYVSPSLSEGFGIPGLNAMASSLPVVCSDIPTFREVYSHAVLYFDPTDPEDIADKIKNLLTDPTTRSDLVEKGKIQAQKYSWLQMAQQTLKVYEEVRKI